MLGAKARVWVAGEALIDLVPLNGEVKAIVGGGPANTAKALAKLGIEVCFIGGISSDRYGAAIREELDSVDLCLALESELPTALAEVSLDSSGSASYKFTLEETATFDFHTSWLPYGSPDILHIGTLATLVEPGASELYSWAKGLDSVIVFDPNVRSSVLGDAEKYREIFESWALISKIVKMSEEDLHFLGYSGGEEVLELGPELVVVTRGADGMEGITSKGLVSVPGAKVNVVDTVGAGDTVGAILVEGLLRYGFDDLKGKNLFTVLTRATRAAAITCSRAGANPPSAKELEL